MRLILRWLFAALALSLGACELIVDPQSSTSSTGTSATTVGNGSTTGGATTGSGSGSGSIGSGSGTSAAASSGSGSTSSTAGAGSSGSTGVVTTGPATTGGSGSTGPTCQYGMPGPQDHSCGPSSVNGTLNNPATFPTSPEPDDLSPCDGGYCTNNLGEDSDWDFPVSAHCEDTTQYVNVEQGNHTRVHALRDTVTNFDWMPLPSSADQYSKGVQHCSPQSWELVDGGPMVALSGSTSFALATELPPAQALFSLMTRLVNDDGGLMDRKLGAQSGLFFASETVQTTNAYAYAFNFTSGTFGLVSTGSNASGLCVLAESGLTRPAPRQDCRDAGNGSQDCALLVDGTPNSPDTGLYFHIEARPTSLSFGAARTYCNNLGGCNVYRLPSYKELGSLANFEVGAPTNTFVDDLDQNYWSATHAQGGWLFVIHNLAGKDGGGADIAPASFTQAAATDGGAFALCVTGP